MNNSNVYVNVYYSGETFWLTQKAMAELFGCSTDNISLHLKNIFSEGELDKDSVTEKYSATAADGKNYLTTFYSLDAIIAVGYRVNSKQATAFHIWATQMLKEYIIKGICGRKSFANSNNTKTIFPLQKKIVLLHNQINIIIINPKSNKTQSSSETQPVINR